MRLSPRPRRSPTTISGPSGYSNPDTSNNAAGRRALQRDELERRPDPHALQRRLIQRRSRRGQQRRVGRRVFRTGSQPLIEHWDGTSWSVVSSPNLTQGGFLSAVTAISTNNVWAVGEDDNLSVDLVEHWDGTSWSVVSSPAFNGSGRHSLRRFGRCQ